MSPQHWRQCDWLDLKAFWWQGRLISLKTWIYKHYTRTHTHTCTSAKAHLLTFEKLVHNPFQATASTNTTTFKLIKQYKNK